MQSFPRPGLSESYSYGWQQMLKSFLPLLLLVVFLAFADAPTSVFRDEDWGESLLSPLLHMVAVAYAMLVLPVFNYGGDLLFVRAVREEPLEVEAVIQGFRENYVHIVLAHLLATALIVLGFVFLIVPGIILACRLVFVSYLVMDKRLEPIAAIEKSWEMTRGQGLRIFGMGLLAIPVFILGLLCLGVGALVSVMWIKSAFASLYYATDLLQQEQDDPYRVRD
ncbi:DUF975 family protein [Robiginitalea sp. SC105]|uniref:DUF975 family protein n=1 Tax=Robiginitalea sp. SC105 TaxID=2762332 RepID=UPI001C8ED8BD|nr:DUF975 family protein [Robiginitalea sp. SC105]